MVDKPIQTAFSAQAASFFADTVDNLQPQKGLSMQLPELSGVSIASNTAGNSVPIVAGVDQGQAR